VKGDLSDIRSVGMFLKSTPQTIVLCLSTDLESKPATNSRMTIARADIKTIRKLYVSKRNPAGHRSR